MSVELQHIVQTNEPQIALCGETINGVAPDERKGSPICQVCYNKYREDFKNPLKSSVNDAGSLLEAERNYKGISIRELARRAKVSPTTVQRVLKGDVNTRLRTVCKLYDALGIAFDLKLS